MELTTGIFTHGYTSSEMQRYYAIIQGVQEIEGRTPEFQMNRGYPGMFCAIVNILSQISPNIDAFRMLVEKLPDGEIQHLFNTAKNVASNGMDDLPFSGIKILEIGGPFGQILHALGAEAWCVDPDIDTISEHTNCSWGFYLIDRHEEYHTIPTRVNLTNWKSLLEENYFDLTYSRLVLCMASGTSSDWRKVSASDHDLWLKLANETKDDEAIAREEIFKIAAMVTKQTGLILHEGESQCLAPLIP